MKKATSAQWAIISVRLQLEDGRWVVETSPPVKRAIAAKMAKELRITGYSITLTECAAPAKVKGTRRSRREAVQLPLLAPEWLKKAARRVAQLHDEEEDK